MKRYTRVSALLALALAALLLLAGGAGRFPGEQVAAAEPEERTVEVSTVDELLSALAPHTTIVLQPGEYDLTAASDYGEEELTGNYRWELVLGGAQLSVNGLEGLRLTGGGQASILTRPRYAEVICFNECDDLRLDGLTLGHTMAPSGCNGGVLSLGACNGVEVSNCRLFGCGVLGVSAVDCQRVDIHDSQIDDCSNGALFAHLCRDLRLVDCRILDCGQGDDGPGGSLFFFSSCRGVGLVNCQIQGNRVQELVGASWSDQVALLGCSVAGNRFYNAAFALQGRGVTVDQCAFALEAGDLYYPDEDGILVQDLAGEALTSAELDAMEQSRAEYDGPREIEVVRPTFDGARTQVHAATVEELLSAIAPNTTILLDAGVYDLSAAPGYGGPGGEWYGWEYVFDGFSLLIRGVQGLEIIGAGKGETVLTAAPRYAAVMGFRDCQDVRIQGVTAGHSEAPGYCSGNVLDFDVCQGVTVEDCGLYGCGVLGVWAYDCIDMAILNSEIYECANGAADFYNCWAVRFEGCRIHDCDEGQNYISVYASDLTWNGQPLSNGVHAFQDGEYLFEVRYE